MWLISVTSFLKIAKLSLDLILNLIGVLIITSCDFLSFMLKNQSDSCEELSIG